MAAVSAAELEGGGAVPEKGEQSPDDEGAFDFGEGCGCGTAGGAAERLGVLQAGGVLRYIVELGFRGCGRWGSVYEPGREADDAIEAVDRGIRASVRGSHDLRLRGVSEEASAEASGVGISREWGRKLRGQKSGKHWPKLS